MRYFVFLDESGEANIKNPDPRFNVFVLCAVVFSERDYEIFNEAFDKLKIKHFGNKEVVFHSVEMRKKTGPFKIFQNHTILEEFYKDIKLIFTDLNYTIISCIVRKEEYKEVYQERNTAYEDALTFISERCLSLTSSSSKPTTIHFCLEKRNSSNDRKLKKVYTQIRRFGTEYMSTSEYSRCHPKIHFRGKKENVNGLQFSDLIAYPIARKELSPESPQPTYDLFEGKIYCNWRGQKEGWGLKYFPTNGKPLKSNNT